MGVWLLDLEFAAKFVKDLKIPLLLDVLSKSPS